MPSNPRRPGWPYRCPKHGVCVVTKVTETRIAFRRKDGVVIHIPRHKARSYQPRRCA